MVYKAKGHPNCILTTKIYTGHTKLKVRMFDTNRMHVTGYYCKINIYFAHCLYTHATLCVKVVYFILYMHMCDEICLISECAKFHHALGYICCNMHVLCVYNLIRIIETSCCFCVHICVPNLIRIIETIRYCECTMILIVCYVCCCCCTIVVAWNEMTKTKGLVGWWSSFVLTQVFHSLDL